MLVSLIASSVMVFAPGKLEIKDVVVGKGDAARPFDLLTMDYTGKLLNGKQFDTSIGKAPFVFQIGIGQVIKGWDQGVVGMKVGGKRLLTIPAELGYGAQGAGDDIPPNATLKFEVSLKKIDRAKITTVKAGTGPAAKFGDKLDLNYRGTLADGKEFDSSYGRGVFTVELGKTGLIPGFNQGLFGMKKGEKRKVVIPPDLGYGARGAGGVIPPNATITFEIEMVRVTPEKTK